MKKFSLKLGLMSALLVFAVSANAEDRVAEVWNCTLEDGKTIADVQAANGKWVKHMNANVADGGINSYVLTPIVATRGGFIYVDSYPSLVSWSAGQELASDELTAIEEELNAVAKCGDNTLHNSGQS
jgi:hypothetical protein